MAFLGKLWKHLKRQVRTTVRSKIKGIALQYGASLIPGGSIALSWVQKLQHFKNQAKGFLSWMPSAENRLSNQGPANPWLRGHMTHHRATVSSWRRRYPQRYGIGTSATYRRAWLYMQRHRRRIIPGISLHRGRQFGHRRFYGG